MDDGSERLTGDEQTAIVAGFLGAIAGRDVVALGGLLADDAHMEFPYDEGSRQHEFDGRTAFVEYFGAAFQYLDPIVFSDVIVHPGLDGRTFVAEFRGDSRWIEADRAYRQRYIAVFEVDDAARIATYREYRNPLAY